MTDPATQIDDSPEAVQHRILQNLTAHLEHAPIDALILALQQACQNTGGTWMIPPEGKDRLTLRPATHLVEIHVLGVMGTGLSSEEAARNWRRAALNLTEGRTAA